MTHVLINAFFLCTTVYHVIWLRYYLNIREEEKIEMYSISDKIVSESGVVDES